MLLQVNAELRAICQDIARHNYGDSQWKEHESSDMFQSEHFSGGYDDDEAAFCVSYFAPDGLEYWFQFGLREALDIANGTKASVSLRRAP